MWLRGSGGSTNQTRGLLSQSQSLSNPQSNAGERRTQEDTFHLFSRGCEFCTWHLKALPQAIVLGGCPLECPHANAVLQCIKFGHSRVLALNLNLLAVMSVHLPSGTTFSKAYSFSWLNPKKKKILDHFQHPHFPLMNQDSTLSCYPEQAVINWVCFDS